MVAAIGVGRFAPELLPGATWPYAALGCGYAALAMTIFLAGLIRHRDAAAALEEGRFAPLQTGWVGIFTAGGAVLTLATLMLIVF